MISIKYYGKYIDGNDLTGEDLYELRHKNKAMQRISKLVNDKKFEIIRIIILKENELPNNSNDKQ